MVLETERACACVACARGTRRVRGQRSSLAPLCLHGDRVCWRAGLADWEVCLDSQDARVPQY